MAGTGDAGERRGSERGLLRGRFDAATRTLRQVDPASAKRSASSGTAGARDVVKLAVAYTKQETIDPLRNVGRVLAWGAAGAILLGFGMVLLVLALLRVLQSDTGSTFTGHLSWIPYLLARTGVDFERLFLGHLHARDAAGRR